MELVRRILSCGADSDRSDYSGKNPLHWSLSAGSEDCLQILLESKADVDAKDKLGRTPLCLAVQLGTSCQDIFHFWGRSKWQRRSTARCLCFGHHITTDPRFFPARHAKGLLSITPIQMGAQYSILLSLNNYGILRVILKHWPLL